MQVPKLQFLYFGVLFYNYYEIEANNVKHTMHFLALNKCYLLLLSDCHNHHYSYSYQLLIPDHFPDA